MRRGFKGKGGIGAALRLLARGELAIAAAALLLSACAGPQPLLKRVDRNGPQWPAAPEQERIRWIKNVQTPEDAGISKTFWRKVVEVLTGSERLYLSRPYGVLFDAAGRLFVADTGAGVVHLMDTKLGRYSRIGAPGGFRFVSPVGLAEDDQGGVYITDSSANTVYRYDTGRNEVAVFARGMERPTGIVYNRVNKLLYIAETEAGRIVALDLKGGQKATIGGSEPGLLFNRPVDLAVDRKGQLYVDDPLNYRIKIFTPEGQLVSEFGKEGDASGDLDKPKGLAVDREGHIYVCDAGLDAVQIFDERGRLLLRFGSSGTGAGSFWMPSGISIQGDHIFVTDTYNRRIQVFRYLPAEAPGAEPD